MKKIILLLVLGVFSILSIEAQSVWISKMDITIFDYKGNVVEDYSASERAIYVEIPEKGRAVIVVHTESNHGEEAGQLEENASFKSYSEGSSAKVLNLNHFAKNGGYEKDYEFQASLFNKSTNQFVFSETLATITVHYLDEFEKYVYPGMDISKILGLMSAEIIISPLLEDKENKRIEYTVNKFEEISTSFKSDIRIYPKFYIQWEPELPFSCSFDERWVIINNNTKEETIQENDWGSCDIQNVSFEDGSWTVKLYASIRKGSHQPCEFLLGSFDINYNSPTSNIMINANKWVEVYDIKGMKVKECFEEEISNNLKSGIYIVKSPNNTYKIAL